MPLLRRPAIVAVLILTTARLLGAQEPTDRRPDQGGTVLALGMPPVIKGHAGFATGWYRPSTASDLDVSGFAGVSRDLMSPVAGVAALGAEGYGGFRGQEGAYGGVRGWFAIPALHFATGADWNITDGDVDWLLRLELSLRRSGIFGRGTQVRFDWLPGRDGTFSVGINAPLWGRNIGKTRPQRDAVELGRPPVTLLPRPQGLDDDATATDSLRVRAVRLTRLVMPLTDHGGADPGEAYAAELDTLRADLAAGLGPADAQREWHATLAAVFARALGPGASPALVESTTTRARRVLLDEILLPWGRLLGQRKANTDMPEFIASAHAGFERWMVVQREVPRDRYDALTWTFQRVVEAVDSVRAHELDRWGDSRLVWLPLQLALRTGDTDTQAELDALIEQATDRAFHDGNRTWYLMNEEFQLEFYRSVHAARHYHVLWIHDYRGNDGHGGPDSVGFVQTVQGYMQAMADRIEQYDSTGVIPEYFIFLDQNYFEINGTRRWFRILEDPLREELDLPDGYDAWEAEHAAMRARLVRAVEGSRLLQAERRQYGDEWLRKRIRVHINVTNPSDFSFMSNDVASFIPVPDNVMRDHRKIAFYDLTEDDPYAGRAMYTGMGIGEHYAGPGWEDRALMVSGPSALAVRDQARALLEQQGYQSYEIPLPLRARPLPDDYEEQVRAFMDANREESLDPRGRVLELHNLTGYAAKPINIEKAILYSLMPAGSVLKIPDSLWQSYLYASLLTGSALRGCKVLIVAPTLASAPSSAPTTMARAHGLLSALVHYQRELADDIAARDGLLRVGLYAPTSGVGDLQGRLRQVRGLDAPWLRELLHANPGRTAVLDSMIQVLADRDAGRLYLVEGDSTATPKLHLKANLFVDGHTWDLLMARSEWDAMVREYIAYLETAPSRWTSRDLLLPDALAAASRALERGLTDDIQRTDGEHVISYFTIGSTNMNYRSMVMDGEVQVTVTGWGTLPGLTDFLMLMALCQWPETQAELDELLPPPGGFTRSMANLIRMLL